MTLTDDETTRLYGIGGPCERWVVRSRYLTPDEVADAADACISELLTELVHGSRLAARWCDERSDALMRAEKAEADAMRLKALADERWEKCEHETAMREQAEAEASRWKRALRQLERGEGWQARP